MIIRQQKRWCAKCHQNVFARGHEHGLEVVPPAGVQMEARVQEWRGRGPSLVALLRAHVALMAYTTTSDDPPETEPPK